MSLLPFSLTEVIYEELLTGRRANDGLLHASSHLTGSLRHAQLDVAGAPRLPQTLIREVPMWTGSMWHDWLQARIKQLGIPAMMEVDITPWMPRGWGGRADLFVWNPKLRAFVLVDLKTTKGDGLKWIKSGGAKPEHLWQVSSYWHAAKKAGFPMAKEALIYYLPMSDTRDREEVIEPLEVEITPLPWETLRPEMKSRQEAVAAYLDSLPFGLAEDYGLPMSLEDYVTDALVPVQARTQKISYDRRAGLWVLKLVPHWSSMFCSYPLELCDCSQQGETKLGQWNGLTEEYEPRAGYEDVVPLLVPRFT